jgi:hypothetical protein
MVFPITGGLFEGERLRGRVLAGGGDWVTARADGTFELDLRATLETDDGALIHMTFTACATMNHYLRTLPRFEPPRRYLFLNRRSPWDRRSRAEGPVHTIEEIV